MSITKLKQLLQWLSALRVKPFNAICKYALDKSGPDSTNCTKDWLLSTRKTCISIAHLPRTFFFTTCTSSKSQLLSKQNNPPPRRSNQVSIIDLSIEAYTIWSTWPNTPPVWIGTLFPFNNLQLNLYTKYYDSTTVLKICISTRPWPQTSWGKLLTWS